MKKVPARKGRGTVKKIAADDDSSAAIFCVRKLKNYRQRGKPEVEEQKAPLLKGAVSLKADWRIHPN